jgi:hypothetical protein
LNWHIVRNIEKSMMNFRENASQLGRFFVKIFTSISLGNEGF